MKTAEERKSLAEARILRHCGTRAEDILPENLRPVSWSVSLLERLSSLVSFWLSRHYEETTAASSDSSNGKQAKLDRALFTRVLREKLQDTINKRGPDSLLRASDVILLRLEDAPLELLGAKHESHSSHPGFSPSGPQAATAPSLTLASAGLCKLIHPSPPSPGQLDTTVPKMPALSTSKLQLTAPAHASTIPNPNSSVQQADSHISFPANKRRRTVSPSRALSGYRFHSAQYCDVEEESVIEQLSKLSLDKAKSYRQSLQALKTEPLQLAREELQSAGDSKDKAGGEACEAARKVTSLEAKLQKAEAQLEAANTTRQHLAKYRSTYHEESSHTINLPSPMSISNGDDSGSGKVLKSKNGLTSGLDVLEEDCTAFGRAVALLKRDLEAARQEMAQFQVQHNSAIIAETKATERIATIEADFRNYRKRSQAWTLYSRAIALGPTVFWEVVRDRDRVINHVWQCMGLKDE